MPDGKIGPRHFSLNEVDLPEPAQNEVLVQHLYLSLIPATRAWMHRTTYRNKLEAGHVVPGRALGRVVKSRIANVSEGMLVETMKGWQDYCVCKPDEIVVRDLRRPPEHLLGVLGTNAITAYFGLLFVGRPLAGENLLVSAAAGGIGSLVAQIGKIAGCRVVGVAGGKEKCEWLLSEVGIDVSVDYKASMFASDLAGSCPAGFDLFFDNTGGPVLEAALDSMRNFGRIVCCGNTSQYDRSTPDNGPRGVPFTLILKSLSMTGFVMMTYLEKRGLAEEHLWSWFEAGKLKPLYHVVEGLERAPDALIGMLAGENRGLTLVKI
jgi:NADPH-dependent curcumin reductase CurA